MTERVDLQTFLSNLADDLWAHSLQKNIDKFVIKLVHQRINYLPRRLTGVNRHTPNRYGYEYADAPTHIEPWEVTKDCWEVVNVSRKRYRGIMSIQITAHRIPGT